MYTSIIADCVHMAEEDIYRDHSLTAISLPAVTFTGCSALKFQEVGGLLRDRSKKRKMVTTETADVGIS